MALPVVSCGCDSKWLECLLSSKGALYLNYTGITNLPTDRLCKEHSRLVQKIFCKRNLIVEFPDDLYASYGNVTELYLPSNRLTALPQSIGMLRSLENLNVENNGITDLPRSISSLQQLKYLVLRNNSLEDLPRDIGQLENLELLDVSYNNLRQLNLSFGPSIKLEKLWISHNRLTSLPRHLCSISSLKEICVSSNNIVYLPIDLGRSPSFEMLQISDNKMIFAVPDHLKSKIHNFNCTCRIPLNSDISSRFGLRLHQLTTSSNDDVYILQPRNVYAANSNRQPTLKDLSLTVLQKYFPNGKHAFCDNLPSSILDHLTEPEGHCYYCNKPLFFTIFLKYGSFINFGVISLHTLAYFCSRKCAEGFS